MFGVLRRGRGVSRCLARVALASALAVIGAAPAAGQGGATVGGVVSDGTGGRLPGATVTVTNKATGVTQVLVTGSEGNYRAVSLQPAPYDTWSWEPKARSISRCRCSRWPRM
jgi:hypothetical protein